MSHYYDDIDDDFVTAMVNSTKVRPEVYEKKAKILVTIVHGETKLAGIAALTPKRSLMDWLALSFLMKRIAGGFLWRLTAAT